MLSAKEQREARRRKILERGADRLAYISGDVKALPEAQAPAQDKQQPESKEISFAAGWTGFQLSHTEGFDATVTSRLLKDVQSQMAALDLGVSEEQRPETRDTNGATLPSSGRKEAAVAGSNEEVGELESGKRSHGALKLCRGWSQSMSVSELARAWFAMLLAVLVVGQALLPCEHSSHNWIQRSFPGWPLVLIVVTDVTLALGVLFWGGIKVPEVSQKQEPPTVARDDFSRILMRVSRLGDQLEIWMTVFQTLKGITMDCTVYLVVVICAFSLAQYFDVPVCFKATQQFIML